MYEDSSDGNEFTPAENPQKKIRNFVGKKSSEKRLIVILERASLETVKTGSKFSLLTTDTLRRQVDKDCQDVNTGRPDITHQCLMMLLDSPLNQAGYLQIFIHTEKNVLIEVNPETKVPRTFSRFSGLMVQLLHKLSVRSSNSTKKLLKVIQNPVTQYLPSDSRKVGTSYSSEKVVDLDDYVDTFGEEPVVFVVGAMAHGNIKADYVEETIAINNYPLSAALVCAKICTAFEKKWKIH